MVQQRRSSGRRIRHFAQAVAETFGNATYPASRFSSNVEAAKRDQSAGAPRAKTFRPTCEIRDETGWVSAIPPRPLKH